MAQLLEHTAGITPIAGIKGTKPGTEKGFNMGEPKLEDLLFLIVQSQGQLLAIATTIEEMARRPSSSSEAKENKNVAHPCP